ncbi:tetratricopeptide repeat protein [Noviherbaspirillum sp. UKPF54]|uniref:tetratricopeptide repeat protein n=1 Tax=Noviherbaspirillum sp. UKPF54 TaxID=2601898 RepID=UPI0011B130F4|nr:tetratricopeptide repeat protein [Noviherbaspirillum sp. UKPF54]QDZ28173.1 tetratricopeptide repeat protein [Noviherbaspirillum sp. UKPF54]
MAYDLEEQEQLASLKAWWNQYGNLVTWLLIIALAAYAGWTGWNYYQRTQAAQAGQLYEELQKAAASKDNAKVQRAASDMTGKFGRTAYAQMGALAAARSAFDANDLKAAKAQLQWVVEHGSDEYQAIAKIRLAGILLDEKAFDEALKLLSGNFPDAFAGAVADRKGDILAAQNKIEDARTAYKLALDKTDQKNPERQLIQLKLDALGGAADKAA